MKLKIKQYFSAAWMVGLGILPGLVFSQSCQLKAVVADAQTGELLAGVALRLDGGNTDVYSDSLGQINMLISCGEHNFKLTVLGYKPFSRRFAPDGSTVWQVQMENIQTQMEEVVVQSQGTRRTLETPALGVNILSMRAVQKLPPAAGEVDVLRGLQMLPGIAAVGEGANGINIRGGSVEQNLILLDNMPIFNPTHLLGLFSLFPTDALREMQLYKGSVPARYGGRAAGVLDLKMTEPDLEQFKMRGGVGLISSRLHVEIPLVKNKLSWLSSNRFSANGFLIKAYNQLFTSSVSAKRLPDNNPVFYDLANKVAWHPTLHDHVTLSTYVGYDSYGVDSLFSISGIVPRQATIHYGHRDAALRWNHFYSEQLNLNVTAVRAQYYSQTAAEEPLAAFNYRTQLLNHYAKAEITWKPGERQRWHGGLFVGRYDLKPADLEPTETGSSIAPVHLPKEQAWETALYASDEYEIRAGLLLDAGVRLVGYWNVGPMQLPLYQSDVPKSPTTITETLTLGKGEVESSFFRVEPRLALRYIVDKNSSVKVGYNRMNQFLQMISNNTTPLPDVRWKTSNRYVPPAQSDLVSAGYFRDLPGGMWEWSAEAYFRWQGSLFDYSNGAELNINPLVETRLLSGKGRAYGAEWMISKKKGVMTGWLSYTYARSLEKITGDFPQQQQLNRGEWFPTTSDKPHTINMLVTLQTEKHNALSFTFTCSTGRPYTAPVAFYQNGLVFLPVYTDRNNARISTYNRLDVAWTIYNPSMKERKWQGSWVIAAYNVYGRKNAYSYFFNPQLSPFKPYKVSVFPAPVFSITYNFRFE